MDADCAYNGYAHKVRIIEEMREVEFDGLLGFGTGIRGAS